MRMTYIHILEVRQGSYSRSTMNEFGATEAIGYAA